MYDALGEVARQSRLPPPKNEQPLRRMPTGGGGQGRPNNVRDAVRAALAED
jgi:hypothetical protein